MSGARRAKTITIQVLVPVDEYDTIMTDITDRITNTLDSWGLDYAPLAIKTGIRADI